jgi:hypothetical protein
MKNSKFKISLLTGALCALLAGSTPSAKASLTNEYRPVEQAVTRVMRAAQKVVAKTPYNFDAGICFGVAVVRRGDFISSTYPLQKGVTYVFFGGGDTGAQNIDLDLRDANGKVLAKDIAADAIPAVQYVPKYTGSYRLTLRLKKSRSASSFCSLIVMRKTGGYALPVSVLREAAKPSGQMPAEMKQYGDVLRFHRVRNEWAIYGAVLKQGDATALGGLKFESGNHIFGAFSDGRSKDIGLMLTRNGAALQTQGTQTGATPGFLYQTRGDHTYGLTVQNRKSNGASLIFVTVFDVTTKGGANVQMAAVYMNGQRLAGSAPNINGSVMVPLREVFEAMNTRVEYDSRTRVIRASDGQNVLVMQVGVARASINGRTIPMSAAPVIYAGKVLVPLRFVAEASGADVQWDGARRAVIITSQATNNQNNNMMNDDDE